LSYFNLWDLFVCVLITEDECMDAL
jgi:hypothetical protein